MLRKQQLWMTVDALGSVCIYGKRHRISGGAALLDVCVIINMLLAVAIVTIAAGAIAELQFRMGCVCTAADSTAVVIICKLSSTFCTEGDGLSRSVMCFFRFLPQLCLPAEWQQVFHIASKEQEISHHSHQWEQIMGEVHHGER